MDDRTPRTLHETAGEARGVNVPRTPADRDLAGRAPDAVRRHANDLFEQARALVGDRFAEARYDSDGGLAVSA